MLKSIVFKTFFLLCALNLAYASSISLNIQTNPELSAKHLIYSKQIEFELLEISPLSKLNMMQKLKKTKARSEIDNLPKQKELGMSNGLPVSNQGMYGSCVTFAVTAALDALAQLGNHYSQLCFLQLGSYLFQQGMGPSGWNGLNGYTALTRVNNYGLMNLNQEKTYGCGGLTSYPSNKANSGEMSINEYKQYSKIPRFSYYPVFAKDKDKVSSIKQSLNAGHRIVVGVYLAKADLGVAGAVAWHNYFYDTWVLTKEIQNEIQNNTMLPGHMMIITGYDDNFVARDELGHQHKGLFVLRNSWGKHVGDSGTFYMSYDYMNALAHTALAIKSPVA